jgi:cyclic pyranopterin phosphate synthase
MVDVSRKASTKRQAIAAGKIQVAEDAMETVRAGQIAKGNVVETARLAGIMAAKKTSELIPLCHPVPLDHVDIAIQDVGTGFELEAQATSTGKTGVEMEALTAVSVAALTLYDMIKAADRTMVISDIRLIKKAGGKSGTYVRKEDETNAERRGRKRQR